MSCECSNEKPQSETRLWVTPLERLGRCRDGGLWREKVVPEISEGRASKEGIPGFCDNKVADRFPRGRGQREVEGGFAFDCSEAPGALILVGDAS